MYTSNTVELVTPTKVTTLSHLSVLKGPDGNIIIMQANTQDIERVRDLLNEKDKEIKDLKRRLRKYND